RLEAEKAERRRLREEEAERERLRQLEDEAAAEEERQRVAADVAEREAEMAELRAAAPPNVDPFAEFPADAGDIGRRVLKLMPLAVWARRDEPKKQAAAATDACDLRELIAGLALPPNVAGVEYGRGCRIRRVRVPASTGPANGGSRHPVILSKRALDEVRAS